MSWSHPSFLWLLLSIPLLALFKFRFTLTKRIATANLLGTSLNLHREVQRVVLFLLILFFGILAVAEPKQPKNQSQQSETSGRQIVFLLDVSRSMLVDDLLPNRLGRAKQEILRAIPPLAGNELGLITFAGNAIIKSPLTVDYTFFSEAVELVDVNNGGRGGSLMGDALRLAMDQLFKESQKGFQDIILLTDGDDQESYPLDAAKKVADWGGTLIIFGLGKESPSPIPESESTEDFVEYQGKVVYSGVNHELLQKMAKMTDYGRYIEVSEGSFDLAGIYHAVTEGRGELKTGTSSLNSYRSYGGILVALMALCSLLFALFELGLIPSRSPQKTKQSQKEVSQNENKGRNL